MRVRFDTNMTVDLTEVDYQRLTDSISATAQWFVFQDNTESGPRMIAVNLLETRSIIASEADVSANQAQS